MKPMVYTIYNTSQKVLWSGWGHSFARVVELAVAFGANLQGADLSRADMSGAHLKNVNLTKANLTYANLQGADLSGADLSEANLTYANLRGADLSGAHLQGADLSGASLLNDPEQLATLIPMNNPHSLTSRAHLPHTVSRDDVGMGKTRDEQAQILDDAATFYLRYNPSRSPADTAWPDALRAGAKSLRHQTTASVPDELED